MKIWQEIFQCLKKKKTLCITTIYISVIPITTPTPNVLNVLAKTSMIQGCCLKNINNKKDSPWNEEIQQKNCNVIETFIQ